MGSGPAAAFCLQNGVAAKYAFSSAAGRVSWTRSSTIRGHLAVRPDVRFGKPASNVKLDNFEVNGHYFLTLALSVGAAYFHTMAQLSRATGNLDLHWHQVVAQADYQLPHRADVYVERIYQRVAGGGGVFNAQVYNLSPSSPDSQTVVGLGPRHRF
ncbi:hypothetical protein B0G80_8678 [Paraburkholderia sp. BL6669N2]|uniref:porin n=1 Tax=Paraburkholderia sp. BL6669N2 TaxID=1938807 RepID=UPI000E285FC6|nr:porin [Paraburkholderia sp. BL6669N2]REG52155.1 hypothetical protein B0G80_8678 [Paraburkholderia sp. BL6669N2]